MKKFSEKFSFSKISKYRWYPKNSEPELYLFGIAVGVFMMFVFVLIQTGTLTSLIHTYAGLCPLRRTTGLYCPGCGGTRGIFALFKGHILLSLYYYPAIAYAALIYVVFMLTQTLEWMTKGRIHGLHYRNIYVFIGVAILLGNWIVKNGVLIFLHIHLI